MNNLISVARPAFQLIICVTLFGWATAASANRNDLFNSNFANELGHRIHVLLSGTPEGFREALISADFEGLIDDIANPSSLVEADLAIFYVTSMEDFEKSKHYSDLEPLRERISQGIDSPSFEMGLKVPSQNGERLLRLYFYNEKSANEDFALRGIIGRGADQSDLACLAKRIYALSIFENSEEVLSQAFGECL